MDVTDTCPAFPNVRVERLLGSGAFGHVWQGHHLTLDVGVALKIISSAAPEALVEARRMARLDHPNLLRIYDAGQRPEGIFLITELMDAGSLEGCHRLGGEELLRTARQLLSGLQALHEANLLHRDIKPANCLRRSADGRVKLADLGLSVEHRTRTGSFSEVVGTIPFMAPELLSDAPNFSPRSDLYALGLTLACLALPQTPFPPDASVQSMLRWVLDHPMPEFRLSRADLPENLLKLLDALLQPDPSRRPNMPLGAPTPSQLSGLGRGFSAICYEVAASRRFSASSISAAESMPTWPGRSSRTRPQVRFGTPPWNARPLSITPASLAYSTGGSSRGAPTR